MKKALLYGRSATDDSQSRSSLEQQEYKLRQYCLEENIQVIEFYGDICSGSNFQRPQWKHMMEYVKDHPSVVELILFVDFNRFSRNVDEGICMKGLLGSIGVELCFIEGPPDDTYIYLFRTSYGN